MDKIIYKSSNQYLINNIIIFQTTINNNKFLIDNYANIYYEYNIYYKLIIFNDRLLNDLEIKELIEILNNFEFISFNNSFEHYENINNVILNFLNDKPIKIPRHYQVIYNNPQTHNNYNDILNTYNNYNDILNTHNIIKVLFATYHDSNMYGIHGYSIHFKSFTTSTHNFIKNKYESYLIDDYGNIYRRIGKEWKTKTDYKTKFDNNLIKKLKENDFNINITLINDKINYEPQYYIKNKINEIIKEYQYELKLKEMENKYETKIKELIDYFELNKMENKLKEIEDKYETKIKELIDKINYLENKW